MKNLLIETTEAITRSNHDTEDITFIGSLVSGHSCAWDQFRQLADREYNAGFGGQEVARDLVIVFSDDTLLVREEYDGAEAWRFVQFIAPPDTRHPIKSVFATDSFEGYWSTLEELNSTIP